MMGKLIGWKLQMQVSAMLVYPLLSRIVACFWCVRCPCGHGYEVKGIEERAVSAGRGHEIALIPQNSKWIRWLKLCRMCDKIYLTLLLFCRKAPAWQCGTCAVWVYRICCCALIDAHFLIFLLMQYVLILQPRNAEVQTTDRNFCVQKIKCERSYSFKGITWRTRWKTAQCCGQ